MASSEEKIFRTPSSRPLFMPRIGWKEMRARLSQRRYLPDPLTDKERTTLEKIIEQFNRKSGLQISLVCGRSDVFNGHISSARNFLVLAGQAGDPNLEEKCGYFGEMAVLSATAMGLSTCWVGGTYDRSACMSRLNKGARLVCVIVVGHGAGTAASHLPHRSTKSPRDLSTGLAEAPEWFSDALTAVQLALAHLPSTVILVLLTLEVGVFSIQHLWAFFFMPVALAWVASWLLEKIFRKHMPVQEEHKV